MRTTAKAYRATHIAFSDESHYNVGRFRGLGLVSLAQVDASPMYDALRQLLDGSSVTEFMWKKLTTAKYRFAAVKMIDWVLTKAPQGRLRIDVLMWDTEDARHKVVGRDDIANLQRMYYHLFKNVLRKRWGSGSLWRLHPDEHTAMDWETVADFLDMASTSVIPEGPMFAPGGLRSRLRREFRLMEILPAKSHEQGLVQVADLFVGLAIYSRSQYEVYQAWLETHSEPQLPLFQADAQSIPVSKPDCERCLVLQHLDRQCKRRRLGVSLKTHRGLRTLDPSNPINFWWYTPQHEADRAPTREDA